MEKTITITELVDAYEKASNPAMRNLVLSMIRCDDYIDYALKIAEAQHIINAIMVDENGGFRKNSPMINVFFTQVVIERYTNIEIDNEHFLSQYDLISRAGLLDDLFTPKDGIARILPLTDIARFRAVLDMVEADYMTNHYKRN